VLIEEKILLLITIWVIILLFVTGYEGIEIFFVLTTIGFIAIYEFTAHFITNQLKQKMNILIYTFITVFIILIILKIVNRLNP